MHELSRMLKACPVSQCRHGGHRHGALDPAQGLEGLDHRREAPGLHLLVECVFQTPQAFSLCSNGLDVFLKDQLLRGGGTHHVAEPSQVGGTPVGPTCLADSVPQHEGCAPHRGRLQIPPGLVPCPAQSAEGCSVDGGTRPRGEVPGAQQPGPWPGVTPVGCDPIARLCGPPGGGDAPAAVALGRPGAREPGAAGARCIDADARRTLRLQRPTPRSHSALPGPDRAEGDTLCAMVLGARGDRNSLFMDIHANGERARLCQGGPPRRLPACG